MITLPPTGLELGVNEVMLGEFTVKEFVLIAVPAGVVTEMTPLAKTLFGTVAVIWVSEFIVKVTIVVLNFTVVALVKLAPVIVTKVPRPPEVGVNDVIAVDVTLKMPALAIEPTRFVTLIDPLVALLGTETVI